MALNIWQKCPRARTIPYRLPHSRLRNSRYLTTDSRQRLSKFWAPTGGITPQDADQDESHALLIRGGYVRQAHSGVFHLLPLGLRVQNKLEALIDKHMQSISASKVSLSSITTEALWKQSGRYSANSELLRLKDRKDSGFLLSPTHEEEITALVSSMVHSYKDLPLRLYQIGRKYRDERRPRQGLLRAKEFMMKDLYTFDHSSAAALETYEVVRQAYNNLFDELKLPYLVADADSGNMGGKLSHEYHFVSPKGEDNVWSCSSCSYVANEELVETGTRTDTTSTSNTSTAEPLVFTGISTDRSTAIKIHIPRSPTTAQDSIAHWSQISSHVNLHAVKRALPSDVILDTGIEPSTLSTLLPKTTQTINLYDRTLSQSQVSSGSTTSAPAQDLTLITENAACPKCTSGTLTSNRAIEVGHTFHLGTRYSEPLNALVAGPDSAVKTPVQMGCHGIGVSRIIGAVAALLSDERGLNWPRVVAPFEVVVMGREGTEGDLESVYDVLSRPAATEAKAIDAVIDDRAVKRLGWKLKDADLIGYPIVVVLGRGWKDGVVEVQCRRLGVKSEVKMEELRGYVDGLLEKL